MDGPLTSPQWKYHLTLYKPPRINWWAVGECPEGDSHCWAIMYLPTLYFYPQSRQIHMMAHNQSAPACLQGKNTQNRLSFKKNRSFEEGGRSSIIISILVWASYYPWLNRYLLIKNSMNCFHGIFQHPTVHIRCFSLQWASVFFHQRWKYHQMSTKYWPHSTNQYFRTTLIG